MGRIERLELVTYQLRKPGHTIVGLPVRTREKRLWQYYVTGEQRTRQVKVFIRAT